MRSTIMVALAAMICSVAVADKRDFPLFDPLHAHCATETDFPGEACADVFKRFVTVVNTFRPEPNSKGFYRTVESTVNDYLWVTRTTPVAKYVDDIIFIFYEKIVDSAPYCEVSARSRSQTFSYFDYDTNYCNMWTVYQSVGGFEVVDTSKCTWIPDNARKVCAIY